MIRIGREYERRKLCEGTNRYTKPSGISTDTATPERTREEMAKEHGIAPATIARYAAKAKADAIQAARKNPMPPQEIGCGKAGPGRGKKTGDDSTRFGRGSTSSTYLLRRLARVNPEILNQLEAGEFKSVRGKKTGDDVTRLVGNRTRLAGNAREQAKIRQGERRDLQPPSNGRKLAGGGNQSEYLLRRLARIDKDQQTDSPLKTRKILLVSAVSAAIEASGEQTGLAGCPVTSRTRLGRCLGPRTAASILGQSARS